MAHKQGDESPDRPKKSAPPARALSRATTEYHPVQDRLRIAGDPGDGTVLVLWVTQRMLSQLVPQLLEWIAGQEAQAEDPVSRPDLMQSVKQQSATRRLGQSESKPVAASKAAADWLVTAVDLQKRPEFLRLVFRAPDQHKERIVLDLRPLPMRQWLHILMLAYQRAGWGLDLWPEWMLEQLPDRPRPDTAVLH